MIATCLLLSGRFVVTGKNDSCCVHVLKNCFKKYVLLFRSRQSGCAGHPAVGDHIPKRYILCRGFIVQPLHPPAYT